jgi:DNA repair exonuclease SbcCD ATPase subunit
MKLRLVNFRCYDDKSFDFGDEGLVLISAPSGCGKSTILFGIYFGLFGYGNKLQKNGKSSCRVELCYKNLNIIRTKKPNKLIVNDKYIDDAGQELINKTFGPIFENIGYISQNAANSFILKSPCEKLDFLENISFTNVNLSKLKSDCKDNIKNKYDELNKTNAKIDLNEKMLKEFNLSTNVEYPFNNHKLKKPYEFGSKNYITLVKNEHTKLKNNINLSKKNISIINNLQKELNDTILLKSKLNQNDENKINIEKQINEIELDINNNIYVGDEELNIMKEKLNISLQYLEYLNIENEYNKTLQEFEEYKINEKNKITNNIEEITNNLWIDYTKEETAQIINDLKQFNSQLNSIDKEIIKYNIKPSKINTYIDNYITTLNKKEEELKIKLAILEDKEYYNCPSCNISLKLYNIDTKTKILKINNNNECINPELDTELDLMKNDIEDLNNYIKEYTVILNNLKLLKNSRDKLINNLEYDIDNIEETLIDIEKYSDNEKYKEKQLEKLNNILKNNLFDYSFYDKKINCLKKKLENNSNIQKLDIDDIENLKEKINKEENKKNLINYKNILLEKNNNKLKEIILNSNEIMKFHLNQYNKLNDESDLNIKINELKNNNLKIENENSQINKTINQISLYEQYIKQLDTYNNWKTQLNELYTKQKEDTKLYNAAILMKNKILEAESISIDNVIKSINIHAQTYLEYFFTENPIIIQLLAFKENKNKITKPQINIDINYKEMENCDLNSLSGGEISRVILAFTLALAEIFDAPLIMLDEATASLDANNTSLIFDNIKQNLKDKLVLIVAHQVVEGSFDKVIQL